jgi:hypothetical protein
MKKMQNRFELDHMLKAQQWERAKGELRAFAAMCGSYNTAAGMGERWEEIVADIEGFISIFERDGKHE